MVRWYGLEEDPINTLTGLEVLIRSNWDGADVRARADPDAASMDLKQKTLKMPAQIPILCRIPTLTELDLQDTHMCVTQAHDAKKGLYRLVEPDLFPTKLFDSDTAGILRCLPQSVLTKFGQAWD